MNEIDYYALLGVDPDASPAEIKSAYRGMARNLHPDTGGDPDQFHRLRRAYETLIDPVRRTSYDRCSATGQAGRYAVRPSAPGTRRTPNATAQRPSRRHRRFGEDPHFTPAASHIDVATIPWWRSVEPQRRPRIGRRTPLGHAPAALLCATATLALVLAVFSIDRSGWLVASWPLSALIVAAAWLGSRYRVAAGRHRHFAAEFGCRAVFGHTGATHDQRGERLTADLLSRYLTRLPGAQVFHGLAWPGSVFADIDHAVLCGHRLVLCESKLWLPGHYDTDDAGILYRNGRRFRGGGSRLAEAVAAFGELLPEVDVRGALLVYPSRAGEITTGQAAHATVPPMTPEQFVADIGAWLATEPPWMDPATLRTVRGQVVGSSPTWRHSSGG